MILGAISRLGKSEAHCDVVVEVMGWSFVEPLGLGSSRREYA
jgi:hypothetical protein